MVATCLSTMVQAGVPMDLPYPKGEPTAEEIITQVYFVNHFYALKNVSIEMDGKTVTVIIYKSEGGKPTTNTLKRYLNNDYSDGVVKAKDLAIFTSGKERGMGMLITDYVDDEKSQSYQVWVPELRKIRLFSQPPHNDAWGGTDFTFGDVTLRKPAHETHQLLGKEKFPDCLTVMEVGPDDRNWYMKTLPEAPVCDHKDKQVYKVKSTTKFTDWWYDYRISYIDTKTFGDYRTEYFKGDKKVKFIDRDWGSLDTPDPRALYWKFWYGKNLVTNHETMALVPREVFRFNTDKKASLWTEETLTQIHR
ncbi:MAG: outer membrane lipoprotein-sorting protein [Magnetococcales bacterium]|nr:outer membrane lipoprotein-sorting protein [Magnetococcales bacterium]